MTVNQVTVTSASGISVVTVGTQGLQGTSGLLGAEGSSTDVVSADNGGLLIYDHSNTQWVASTQSAASSIVAKVAALTFTAGGASVTGVLDEDNMSTNSATKLATQQSIKAYVDTQVGTVNSLSEIIALGNTTSGVDISLTTDDKVTFRDSAIYINSSADGQLDIVADTEIQISATTIDINGAINASGEIIAASLDISGNVDIDGVLEADAVTINGSALVLTANDFTDADHSKLDGIEANATADQTNAEIKAAVEAATDSNTFTDADHSKLNGIEASATADQTNTEIRTAVEAATDSNVFTDADHTKLNAIEASADVTDTTNVTAAGALMDSELSDLAGVKGVTISTLQVKPSEGAFANGDKTKLDAIEASADVTDTTNVTSAGALMDSEVTNLAQVKAFDESDYATAAQGATADAALPKTGGAMTGAITTNSTFDGRDVAADGVLATNAMPKGGGAFTGAVTTNSTFDGRDVATDGTKLDGIEASATADQTDAEIRTAVEAASDSNVFTDADHTKLNAIEASADVTDSTNVVAALTAGTGITIAANGTIAASPLALTTVQTASSESAQLALTAEEGDVVVRSDENKSYMHNGGTAGSMDDYTLLATPTDAVLSVNGVTGAVTAAHIATAVEAASGSNTFTDADHSKLNAIEASADVTDATNVTAAGALMDSELTDLAGVKGVTISTLQVKPSEGAFANGDKTKLDAIESSATADQTNAEIRAAVEAATDSNVFTDADHTKLNGIEASADVTDATNVTAAGALMDSEITNLAQVKAFATSDYATAAQGTTANAALPKSGGAMTGAITTNSTFDGRDVATDGTKLDGIEASATADQSAAEIKTLLEDGIDSVHYVDGSIDTAHIGDDQVTADKLANSINSAIAANTAKTGITTSQASAITANTAKTGISSAQASAITANTAKTGITSGQASAITANTAKVTNATHSGEVTGATALTIADNVVDEANLKVSNSPTNGYALTAQSGNTGGLTWAEISGGGAGTLTDTLSEGNRTTGAEKIEFRDAAIFINSSADGQLDIVADTEIQIAATTVDIDGAVALNGAITGATNITLSGELDAATGDFSGDVDVDGTLEADAITLNGTALGSIFSPIAGGTGILTTGALDAGSITSGFGAINNGASNITTTGVGSFASLDISGDVDVDGTLEADAITLNGTALGSLYSPIAGSSSIVTTGALNSGSITSGFGTINNGASAITTTGALGAGATTVTTFTSTGIDDNASSTALTLDSSQDATFAGQLQYVGASAGLYSTTSGTADNTIRMDNTNNATYIGINGASGNRFSGSSAYFTTVGTASARGLELATNNTVRFSIDSAGDATFTGTINGNGSGITALNGSNISSGTVAAARVATLNQNTTGSAATLTTARTIAGVSFNGSANISLNNNAITNGAGYTTNVGDITGVTAGTGLTGGGTSGTVTLNVGTLNQNTTGSSGSCTGNAATVTNGVYTTGTQTIGGAKTFSADIAQTKSGASITQTSTSHVSNFMNAATANWAYTRMQSGTTYYDLAVNTGDASGAFQIRPAASATNAFKISTAGDVTVNGSVTATGNVTAYSDLRLKTGIETIDSALEKVSHIRGVTFTMNDKRGTGVIAQELEQVLPEAVFDNEGGMKSVAYGNMVGLLIEAIKELKAEVEELKGNK